MGIYIYGAGEQGKVTLEIFNQVKNVEIIGFIDDNKKIKSNMLKGHPIFNNLDELKEQIYRANHKFIVAIGDNHIREKIFTQLKNQKFNFVNAIHPTAIISNDVTIEKGNFIGPGAIINIDTKINNNCIINTGAILEHDNTIQDHVNLGPGTMLAGGVTIKKNSYIGIGAKILDDLTVGENSVVGAGALVTKDVPADVIVMGVPAKIVKNNK